MGIAVVAIVAVAGVVALASRMSNLQTQIADLQDELKNQPETPAAQTPKDSTTGDTILIEDADVDELRDKVVDMYAELDNLHNQIAEINQTLGMLGNVPSDGSAPAGGSGAVLEALQGYQNAGPEEKEAMRNLLEEVLDDRRAQEREERNQRWQNDIGDSLANELQLTETQKSQVAAQVTFRFEEMAKIREMDNLSDEDATEKRYQVNDQMDQQMKNILNVEQFQKYTAWKNERDWWSDRNKVSTDNRRNRRNRSGGGGGGR
jgi:hypothetical protein